MSVSERTSERMNDGKYMTQGGGQQMKKGKNSALRSRAMMYVNHVRHSPYKDVDSLQNKIDSDIHPKDMPLLIIIKMLMATENGQRITGMLCLNFKIPVI